MIIPGIGFDFDEERDGGQEEDSSPSSAVLILSNNKGERERPLLLTRSELDDRTRLSVLAEIVVPATGDALTIVPGIGVGGGDGLSERKSGWMFFSLEGRISFGRCGLMLITAIDSRLAEGSVGEGGDGRIKRLSIDFTSESVRCGAGLEVEAVVVVVD